MALSKAKKSTTKKTTKKDTTKKEVKKTGRIRAVKKEVDGITFDSTMEANYYEYLKAEQAKGKILYFKLQPEYQLLDGYEKYGRKIRGIKYIADFLVVYADDTELVIDVKGRETDDFKLKRKLFDAKYPDLTLKLITYNKTTESWVDYDELKKTRAKAKREKNKAAKAKVFS